MAGCDPLMIIDVFVCVCVWDDEPVHELSSLIDCESILKARIIAGFHLRSYMYMMCVCVCVRVCV